MPVGLHLRDCVCYTRSLARISLLGRKTNTYLKHGPLNPVTGLDVADDKRDFMWTKYQLWRHATITNVQTNSNKATPCCSKG